MVVVLWYINKFKIDHTMQVTEVLNKYLCRIFNYAIQEDKIEISSYSITEKRQAMINCNKFMNSKSFYWELMECQIFGRFIFHLIETWNYVTSQYLSTQETKLLQSWQVVHQIYRESWAFCPSRYFVSSSVITFIPPSHNISLLIYLIIPLHCES